MTDPRTSNIPIGVREPDPITIAAIARLRYQKSVTLHRLVELAGGCIDRLLMIGCVVRINSHGVWLCLEQFKIPVEARRQSGFLATHHGLLVLSRPAPESGKFYIEPVPPWQTFLIHGHVNGARCGCLRFDDGDDDATSIFSNNEICRTWKATK